MNFQITDKSFRSLWLALDNQEKIEALIRFNFALIDRMRQMDEKMDKTVSDVKAELDKLKAYVEKWFPWHQKLVDHHAANPPAAINEVHASVVSLMGQVETEGNKAGTALGLFTPPEAPVAATEPEPIV